MHGTDAASEIDGSSASPTRGASPATLAQGSRWQVGHPKCSKLVRPEEPARLQPWFVLSTWAVDHAVYSQLSDLQIRGFLASLSTFIVSFDFNSCHVALAIHAQSVVAMGAAAFQPHRCLYLRVFLIQVLLDLSRAVSAPGDLDPKSHWSHDWAWAMAEDGTRLPSLVTLLESSCPSDRKKGRKMP